MGWLSYVFLGLTIFGYTEYGHNQHSPLYPWDRVGADPFVMITNATPDTEAVFAQAPQVDGAWRFLAIIAPNDSALVKLPYADADVLIRIAAVQKEFAKIN